MYTKNELLDFIGDDHLLDYRINERIRVLHNLLPKLKTNELSEIEMVFITDSFINKLDIMSCDIEYYLDDNNEPLTDVKEFEAKFLKPLSPIKFTIRDYHDGRPYNDMDPATVKYDMIKTIKCYTEAKEWMSKKGYKEGLWAEVYM